MNFNWLAVISGVFLFLAIPTGWPYEFYILLKWFITGSSVVLAYRFYESKITHWALVFGGVAFLFNPILPIYLDKQTWVIIDLIVAIIFFVSSGVVRKARTA